jgi:signal peptidase II
MNTRNIAASVLFLGCVGCDQLTKGVVRANLVLGEGTSYLGDTVRLTHVENPGAFLSLGETLPHDVRSGIFIVAVGLVSLGALLAALFVRNLTRMQTMALALIASGGIGNWIDRLTHDGRVTDFLNVGVGSFRTGIFNVADMVLLAGIGLYAFGARSANAEN